MQVMAGIAALIYLGLGLGMAFRSTWRREDPLSYTMGLVFFGTCATAFALAAIAR
mgnify:CR=1 FL=1